MLNFFITKLYRSLPDFVFYRCRCVLYALFIHHLQTLTFYISLFYYFEKSMQIPWGFDEKIKKIKLLISELEEGIRKGSHFNSMQDVLLFISSVFCFIKWINVFIESPQKHTFSNWENTCVCHLPFSFGHLFINYLA